MISSVLEFETSSETFSDFSDLTDEVFSFILPLFVEFQATGRFASVYILDIRVLDP